MRYLALLSASAFGVALDQQDWLWIVINALWCFLCTLVAAYDDREVWALRAMNALSDMIDAIASWREARR